MQSLSEVRAGEACTIKWMFGNIQALDFLRSHDIKEGSLIKVLQQWSSTTIIGMDNKRFALGCDVAERIKV